MSYQDEEDDDEDIVNEIAESDLFDISDVKWETKRTKDRKKIYLIATAEDVPFNLLKLYLSLKAYIFQMEQEIGIMEEPPETH